MENCKDSRKTELLAPAGDYECFLSAVKAGADAVYVGGPKFGARAYAVNFTQDELLKAADHAHIHGRKLYLTVNTVLKNREITELYDYISPLYEGGIDGVIVQDAGVIRALRGSFPDLHIHASTQMAITGKEGVLLLKDMGIRRVVPARELSLKEIKEIRKETGIELECFIHGALCYSYSGKCLFSSIAGGRSGNRGRCAGPCRLPYNDQYILSAKDISTIDILPDLIEAGISSFKIEGRMKSREYVAGVTGIYRKYIDRYLTECNDDKKQKYRVDGEDLRELDELYTRSGHCRGYYYDHNGADMITVSRPGYDSADDERMKVLFNKYTGQDDKLKCTGYIRAFVGEPLLARVECSGKRAECIGEVVEKALKQPTSVENIKKQFLKTGDTPYKLEELVIDSGNDIFIPVSALNSLRRQVFELLKDKMTLPYKRRSDNRSAFNNMTSEKTGSDIKDLSKAFPDVNIRLDSIKLFDTVLDSGLGDIISIDVKEFNRYEKNTYAVDKDLIIKTAEKIHAKGSRFFLALPPVIRHCFFDRNKVLSDILTEGPVDGVIIDNYESLYFLGKLGFKGRVTGDVHLYCTNDLAAWALHELGIDVLTYPLELNAGELNHLKLKKGEFILYGRAPMMISAQCTQKTIDKCIKDNGVSDIRDRFGNEFPVVRNCGECYNTVLNCVPTMFASKKEIPSDITPDSYRIHFTVEDRDETERVLDFYRAFKRGEENEVFRKRTLLHLKRGVE